MRATLLLGTSWPFPGICQRTLFTSRYFEHSPVDLPPLRQRSPSVYQIALHPPHNIQECEDQSQSETLSLPRLLLNVALQTLFHTRLPLNACGRKTLCNKCQALNPL